MADLVIAGTSEETCSCCSGSPPSCSCALLIPSLGEDPFATLEDAAAAIAGFVSNCIGFIQLSPGDGVDAPPTLTSFDADDSTANEVSLDGVMAVDPEDDGPYMTMFASVVTAATSTLTVAWSVTAANRSDVDFYVLDCTGTTIVAYQTDSSYGSDSGSFTFSDLPAGEYVLVMLANWDGGNSSDEASCTVSCDGDMFVSPVIAQIDPGAGILNNELRACPSMDHYGADCGGGEGGGPFDLAGAENWLENLVASCLVAWDGCALGAFVTINSFTASFGGTLSIDISTTDSSGSGTWGQGVRCSLNLLAGSTLTIDYTASDPSTSFCIAQLYDRFENSIAFGFSSGPSGTIALSVDLTGEYQLVIAPANTSGGGTGSDTSMTVSSDMTMSVNPVVCRYAGASGCTRILPCG